MKHSIAISVLIVAALSANCTAQKFKPEFAVGGFYGMGTSSVSFMPRVQHKQYLGSHFGLAARWITSRDNPSELEAGLQVELEYSGEGWNELYEEQPEMMYKRRLNFLQLPFMTHVGWGSRRFRIFLNLGPQVGYFMSESSEEDVTSWQSGRRQQWDMPLETKFAWGLCGGPGIEVRTGAGYFILEGRYYYSLGDIYGNRKADYFSKSSSQVMQVRLCWLMPLRKKN
jgi:hypothetical protein